MPTWSGKAGKAAAKVAVNLNNICRWIDKSSANTDEQEVFVPFKTDAEWVAFVNAAPARYVALAPCARPGSVNVPPNNPTGDATPCYTAHGVLQTASRIHTVVKYGREGEHRTETPRSMSFSCYTLDGMGPLSKTVTAVNLLGYSADRPAGSSTNPANSDWGITSVSYNTPAGVCGTAHGQIMTSAPSGSALCSSGAASAVGGSGPWTWLCKGLGNTVSCQANKPIPGSCGAANGRSLTSAPSGSELCSVGTASGVSGSGPWSWSCSGYYGGAAASCSASLATPSCPPITTYGPCVAVLGCIAQPENNGYIDFNFVGIRSGVRVHSDGGIARTNWVPYWSGACLKETQGAAGYVSCIATNWLRNNVSGYGSVPNCPVSGAYLSPLKVNLAGGDATMNATTPTRFYLTLKDGRLLEGNVTGGLNPDEGWLMVRRTKGPLVFKNGALNADNWFGDRDGRSVNGYTDLAETFATFLEKDEHGKRYIPLRFLTKEERQAKAEAMAERLGTITDPSFDLRVLDAKNVERLASDYFSRIYVDYRDVTEGDGPKGEIVNNVILERGIVRTVNGANKAAVDQWFVLDLPANLGPTKEPTKSKIHPAKHKK